MGGFLHREAKMGIFGGVDSLSDATFAPKAFASVGNEHGVWYSVRRCSFLCPCIRPIGFDIFNP